MNNYNSETKRQSGQIQNKKDWKNNNFSWLNVALFNTLQQGTSLDDFLKNKTTSGRTLRWNTDKNFILMSVSEFLPTHDQSYLTDVDTQTEKKIPSFILIQLQS